MVMVMGICRESIQLKTLRTKINGMAKKMAPKMGAKMGIKMGAKTEITHWLDLNDSRTSPGKFNCKITFAQEEIAPEKRLKKLQIVETEIGLPRRPLWIFAKTISIQ